MFLQFNKLATILFVQLFLIIMISTSQAAQVCKTTASNSCNSGYWCDPDTKISKNVSEGIEGVCVKIIKDCSVSDALGKVSPVCGVDGKTYQSECKRRNARVYKKHDGKCPPMQVSQKESKPQIYLSSEVKVISHLKDPIPVGTIEQVPQFKIDGHHLIATVSASGGCKLHLYTLTIAKTPLKKSNPPRMNAWLSLNKHGDTCKGAVNGDIQFDLHEISPDLPVYLDIKSLGDLKAILVE